MYLYDYCLQLGQNSHSSSQHDLPGFGSQLGHWLMGNTILHVAHWWVICCWSFAEGALMTVFSFFVVAEANDARCFIILYAEVPGNGASTSSYMYSPMSSRGTFFCATRLDICIRTRLFLLSSSPISQCKHFFNFFHKKRKKKNDPLFRAFFRFLIFVICIFFFLWSLMNYQGRYGHVCLTWPLLWQRMHSCV